MGEALDGGRDVRRVGSVAPRSLEMTLDVAVIVALPLAQVADAVDGRRLTRCDSVERLSD